MTDFDATTPDGPGDDWPLGLSLRVREVTVRRAGALVLDVSELAFEPGRRYVLIGPSGAGKSTLLRLLNRLEDPATGHVSIGDRNLSSFPLRSVRTAVGLVFQASRPLPGTLFDNLAYPFAVRRRPAPSEEWAADRLREVGLDPIRLGDDAEGLSGGERQRLAVAASLAIDPEFLLLDEPTSALDPESAAVVTSALARRAAEGLRTIAVSHIRDHLAMLGDTAVMMNRGRVAAVVPVGEVPRFEPSGEGR